MSTPILCLGESGTGKSYALRHLDPAATLLIQAVHKPLPWARAKAGGWNTFDAEKKAGNVFVTDKASDILALMQGTKRKVIVIDDFQYVLANELMRRYRETGYGKFSEIGYNGWNMVSTASTLAPDVHVYFLAHTAMGEDGITKIKTPGKLLDTYSVEGLFSLVLRTCVRDGEYFFATRNNGSDTVKSPVGMFEADMVPNDLALVDAAVTAFGW